MSRYRFGTFEFDSDSTDLRRQGTAVRVQAQPAQVLGILLEQAGEIVTRETLQQKVWADGTQVDFERGLNYCIAQVRSALGDSADSPRFVKTIPKKGYQFIAPVEAIKVEVAPQPPTRLPSKRWPWLVVAASVLIAAGLAYWRLTAPDPMRPVIAVCQFDNETGDPQFDQIAVGFSDSLTAELASTGMKQVQVIGNADVLRKPRTDQNLNLIHMQLGASYIIVGQIQKDSSQVRVLAHLLRMPRQTHVSIERLDAPQFDNPLQAERDFAHKATQRFLQALASPQTGKR